MQKTEIILIKDKYYSKSSEKTLNNFFFNLKLNFYTGNNSNSLSEIRFDIL